MCVDILILVLCHDNLIIIFDKYLLYETRLNGLKSVKTVEKICFSHIPNNSSKLNRAINFMNYGLLIILQYDSVIYLLMLLGVINKATGNWIYFIMKLNPFEGNSFRLISLSLSQLFLL